MMKLLFAAAWSLSTLAYAGPAPASAPDSPEEFVKRFRAACDRKDAPGLLAMFYTEGAQEKGLDFNKAVAKDLTENKVADVTLAPPRDDAEYVRAAIAYRPNLKVLKTVRISYSKKAESGFQGADLFLGEKDGKYWLTTTIVDTRPAAERPAAKTTASASGAALTTLNEACENEIGLLCPQYRRKGLLKCLRGQRPNLMSRCRAALKAFD